MLLQGHPPEFEFEVTSSLHAGDARLTTVLAALKLLHIDTSDNPNRRGSRSASNFKTRDVRLELESVTKSSYKVNRSRTMFYEVRHNPSFRRFTAGEIEHGLDFRRNRDFPEDTIEKERKSTGQSRRTLLMRRNYCRLIESTTRARLSSAASDSSVAASNENEHQSTESPKMSSEDTESVQPSPRAVARISSNIARIKLNYREWWTCCDHMFGPGGPIENETVRTPHKQQNTHKEGGPLLTKDTEAFDRFLICIFAYFKIECRQRISSEFGDQLDNCKMNIKQRVMVGQHFRSDSKTLQNRTSVKRCYY
ncbi:uncharacterized protein MELLADRAFT_113787 [Melampsora larici-populina 98AG31]|uniref:Uncharacterized protein n=1 Tax=Melampsora larici-populina (strain 98AG31 / pathotype 3-4-7) TaxID=747676 RepID=F4SB23_MELLP|nr:uncharacterized protein MELLADRAFT_113787 [Melampsora larici-populina 98AG31]EGF98160.1 hypothetical protein MELLADRAFT_113787 [Melampsora larici-populina 98AG31]